MEEQTTQVKPSTGAEEVGVSPQPSPPSEVTQPVKKGRKPWLIGVVAAVVLAALVALVGLLSYFNSPDYLMGAAARNLGKQPVLAAKYKVKMNAGFSFEGDFAARSDKDNPENGEAVIGFGTGDTRITLTMRAFDGIVYLKANNLDNFGGLMSSFYPEAGGVYNSPEFNAAFARIDNQWFSLDKQDIKSLADGSGRDEVEGSVSPKDIKKLQEIYARHSFLRADKVFADQTIDGERCAHFSIRLDKKAAKEFFRELKAANLKSFKTTDKDIAEVDTWAEHPKDSTFEVWITRGSKQFKQFEVVSTGENKTTMTATMLTELPKIEKLDKPQGAKPMSELLNSLFSVPSPAVAPRLY